MTVNRIAAGAAVCCAVMFVSACGGGTSANGAAPVSPTTASPGGGAGAGAGSAQRGFPGATGLLAQVDGTTLQVQAADAQTAVTYSAATTFTNTVAAKLADVVVGACVQARSAQPVSGTGGAARPRDRLGTARLDTGSDDNVRELRRHGVGEGGGRRVGHRRLGVGGLNLQRRAVDLGQQSGGSREPSLCAPCSGACSAAWA